MKDSKLVTFVYHSHRIIDELRRWWLIVKAKATGRAYYCRALNGRSNYNLAVNADMTVSCCCEDRDNAGVIGDLRTTRLEDILQGDKAWDMRRSLVRGVPPLLWCSRCIDLVQADKDAAIEETFINYKTPTHLKVENTSVCNLGCLSCSRDIYDASRATKRIKGDDWRNIGNTIKRLGIKSVSFLKLGEPFLSPRTNEEVKTLLEYQPDLEITTSTAGNWTPAEFRFEAALKMKVVVFSIDGINTAMCNRYQRGQDFDRAFQNMCELVRRRDAAGQTFPVVIWKWVVFRWNDAWYDHMAALVRCHGNGIDYLLLTPTANPPWAWSWRFWRQSKMFTTYEPNLGGYAFKACATPERIDYIKTMWDTKTP
jgi:hypothetical protein